MNARVEAAKLIVPNLPFGTDSRTPVSDRATVLIIRLICLVGLLLANYYSWTMTVTGFINTQFLPDNSVFPNTYIPHVVAGFVQLGILAFYLAIPYFSRRHFVLCSAASCFAVSLIFLSVLFALISITLTSQSSSIVSHQTQIVRGMNKKVVEVDNLVSTTFQNHLAGLDSLFQRACQGKDKTQIAKCGPIANGYITQGNDIRTKYGAQLGAPGSYAPADSGDIMDRLITVRSNYVSLSQKVESYQNFANEHNLSSAALVKSFEALGAEIASFFISLNERNPDAKTLVMTRVLNDLGRVFARTAEPLFYFTLMIALLPDLLAVTFTALLLIARTANGETAMLRRAVSQAHEHAEWYNRFATATDVLSRARQRWNDRRRMANVTEAVDQSVPDVR